MARLIDADALMAYCNNQKIRTVDANDIARFPTAYGWISVKDRLPEMDVTVLAVKELKNGARDICLARCIPDYEYTEYPVGVKKRGPYYNNIIYWMPLPEPPEEV